MPSTLVWKNGSRGPENRNKAAACTTASTAGSDSGAVLSRSASTGDAPNARSFAWDADERVRANTRWPSRASCGIRPPPEKAGTPGDENMHDDQPSDSGVRDGAHGVLANVLKNIRGRWRRIAKLCRNVMLSAMRPDHHITRPRRPYRACSSTASTPPDVRPHPRDAAATPSGGRSFSSCTGRTGRRPKPESRTH